MIIWGWLRRFTILGVKLDDCASCGQVGRHVVGRKTTWGHLFWLPLLFLGFRHGMLCEACGAWTELSWRKVRTGMKSGSLPLDRPRPNAPAALVAAGADGWAPPLSPDVLDRFVVNPDRGPWDLYGKVWPVAVAALVLIVAFFPRSTSTSLADPKATRGTASTAQGWADLRVGDCFDAADVTGPAVSLLPSGGGPLMAGITRVACAGAHTFEVFALAADPAGLGSPYPGDQVEIDRSDQACAKPFEAYVGIDYQASHLHARIRTPTPLDWGQGDRLFVCALFDPNDARLTGSQRGTFTPYASSGFGFTVSVPSGWTVGANPGDKTGTLLSGPHAAVIIGVDPAGTTSADQYFAADREYLRSKGAVDFTTKSGTVDDLDWSILEYTRAASSGSTLGIDAVSAARGRMFLLIWTSAPGDEAADLARFMEILQSFRSAS